MSFRAKMKPFRAFVWNQYMENRDEYHAWGEDQPHSFEAYWRANLRELVRKFRLTTR